MKKVLSLLLVVCMMLGVLSACGGSSNSNNSTTPPENTTPTPADNTPTTPDDEIPEEAKYGGTYKISFQAPTNSLDPAQFYTNQNYTPGFHIYEGPVVLDEGGGVWPCVCNYEMSDDGLTITFTVRDGVKFHNGDTVDINDVVASIERSIKWSDKMKNYFGDFVDNVEIKDNMTAIYHLTQIAPLALLMMGDLTSGCKIMPKEIVDKMGDDGLITEDADIIGTGPYKLDKWVRDEYVDVVRFEDYVPFESGGTGPAAAKKGYFDKIHFFVINDANARTNAMMTGELDTCTGVVSDMQKQVEDSGCYVSVNWNCWAPTIMFNLSENNKDSIVQNVNFRRAVLACLDMYAIRNVFGRPPEFYKVDSCIVPDTSVYYNDLFPKDNSNYDLDKAKEYLKASGYNGETITWICADSDSYYKMSLPASQMLEAIGVKVDLQVHEVATYEQEYVDPTAKFDICARENQKPPLNPMLSDRYVSGNITGWWESEARTAALNKLAVAPAGSPESIAAFKEFCQAVVDEVPYIITTEFGTPVYYTNHTVSGKIGIQSYAWNNYFTDNN